jgi:hypothetical protein
MSSMTANSEGYIRIVKAAIRSTISAEVLYNDVFEYELNANE